MPKSLDTILGGIDLIRCVSQSDTVLFEASIHALVLLHSFIPRRTAPILLPALLVDILGASTLVLPAIGLASLLLEIIVLGRKEKLFKANSGDIFDCDGRGWLAWLVDMDCISIAGVLEFRR